MLDILSTIHNILKSILLYNFFFNPNLESSTTQPVAHSSYPVQKTKFFLILHYDSLKFSFPESFTCSLEVKESIVSLACRLVYTNDLDCRAFEHEHSLLVYLQVFLKNILVAISAFFEPDGS